jgi:hypothetical protein
VLPVKRTFRSWQYELREILFYPSEVHDPLYFSTSASRSSYVAIIDFCCLSRIFQINYLYLWVLLDGSIKAYLEGVWKHLDRAPYLRISAMLVTVRCSYAHCCYNTATRLRGLPGSTLRRYRVRVLTVDTGPSQLTLITI